MKKGYFGYVIIQWKLLTSFLLQAIAALVKVSEGDLRKAITFLQSAARLNMDKEITETAIIEIAGVSETYFSSAVLCRI